MLQRYGKHFDIHNFEKKQKKTKNKKTHIHVKKVAHFRICLAFVDKLKKQLFIKKLLEWVNKKGQNFNIYVVGF